MRSLLAPPRRFVPAIAALLFASSACEPTSPRDDASALDAPSLDAPALDASAVDASAVDTSGPDAPESETDGAVSTADVHDAGALDGPSDVRDAGTLDGPSTDAPAPGPGRRLFAMCASTCSVRAGIIRCWGAVGLHPAGNYPLIPTPEGLTVPGITDAVQVAYRPNSHACAVRSTGAVACWGANNYGQLGNGTTAASATPVTVTGLTDAVEVAVSNGVSYARRRGGEVVRWGLESPYRPDGPRSTTPVAFAGVTGATQIVANAGSACALQSNGDALCWGSPSKYTNTIGGDVSPTRVGTGVRHLNLHSSFVCMALADRVVCQGSRVAMTRFFPAMVPLAGVTQLATTVTSLGDPNFYGLRSDGTVFWFGPNSPGGNYPDMPSAIPGIGPVTELTGRCQHACVRLASGAAQCWGINNNGELGDRGANIGATTHATPVTVVVE